jgi:hypothetical protein
MPLHPEILRGRAMLKLQVYYAQDYLGSYPLPSASRVIEQLSKYKLDIRAASPEPTG